MILSDYSPDQITAFAALTTAGIAFVAAAIGIWQVLEARATRSAAFQPFVAVSVSQSDVAPTTLMLRIENIGQTIARDVRLAFDPPLRSAEWSSRPAIDLTKTPTLVSGFASMPPGFVFERVLEDGLKRDPDIADDGFPWSYRVVVEFSDHKGRPQTPLAYTIDFRPLADGSFANRKTINDVVKQLDEITKQLLAVAKAIAISKPQGEDSPGQSFHR